MILALTLLRPGAALLLLLLPVLWFLLRRLDQRRAARLAEALGPRRGWLAADLSIRRRGWRRRLALAASSLALVAILEPSWGHADQLEPRGRDLVLLVDVSRSMLARDAEPDRLGRARAEIRRFVAGRAGDRLALVAFAGEARVLTPLTRDRASFLDLLGRCDPLAVPRGGSDLEAAIDRGLELLDGAEGQERSLIVIGDGGDAGGQGARAAARARTAGVPVHVWGVGGPLGAKIPVEDERGADRGYLRDREGREVISRLDPVGLQALAAAGGGRYRAATEAGLEALLDGETRLATGAAAGGRSGPPRSRFQMLLVAAFLLLVVELALSDRRRP